MEALFQFEINEDNLSFWEDGTLSADAQSYEINGFGCVELTEDKTRELYLAMKKYYED